jgi:membrane-bound serine protease (ClpP class)
MPDVAVWVVIVMFVGGLLAVICELFVPGGILGTGGGLAMIAAIVLGFGKSVALGSILLVAGIVLVPLGLVLAMKVAPRAPFTRQLFLKESLAAKNGYISQQEGLEGLVGKEGVATTDLRPSGMAEIDGRRTDVVTDGEMIEKGTQVKVMLVEGNRVVVEAKSV